MVQIKCLGNGLYSLKNSHIPFGQGFQPPPLTDKDRLNSAFLVLGLPLHPHFKTSREKTQKRHVVKMSDRNSYKMLQSRLLHVKHIITEGEILLRQKERTNKENGWRL